MAGSCLQCWNKLNNSNDTEREFILSDKLDLCEGCGEWKPMIVAKRWCGLGYDLREWFSKCFSKRDRHK